ncbi:MAG: riboflavin biosynthesis protein RibF [Bacilli bacterium]
MEIVHIRYNEINQLKDQYVVAIGNFDGLHQAHRQVIDLAKSIALKENLKVAIMTFDLPPRQLINDISNYYVLRSFDQKRQLLKELGVNTIFLIHFNHKFAQLQATDFIKQVIIGNNIKHVVCGFDFHFGYQRQGDVALLKANKAFKTTVLDKQVIADNKLGTTLINELLLYGEIEKVNEMLVVPYSIIGKVIHGNQRGSTIGFPTANLCPLVNYRILANGVYATKVKYQGKTYIGMSNIGHNPTFNYSSRASIETNIFDFNQDIYGATIEVIFYKQIRKEKIFDGISALVAQLNEDKKVIINYFKEHDHE